MEDIKIKNIQIRILPQRDSLLGFCSFEIFDMFRVSGCALHTKRDGGIKILFPAKKVKESLQFYFQPLSPEIHEIIQRKVEERVKELGFFDAVL